MLEDFKGTAYYYSEDAVMTVIAHD